MSGIRMLEEKFVRMLVRFDQRSNHSARREELHTHRDWSAQQTRKASGEIVRQADKACTRRPFSLPIIFDHVGRFLCERCVGSLVIVIERIHLTHHRCVQDWIHRWIGTTFWRCWWWIYVATEKQRWEHSRSEELSIVRDKSEGDLKMVHISAGSILEVYVAFCRSLTCWRDDCREQERYPRLRCGSDEWRSPLPDFLVQHQLYHGETMYDELRNIPTTKRKQPIS